MKLKEFKKMVHSIGAVPFKDSPILEIKDFLDTGSMALNKVLGGSIYSGFPVGRISTLYGPSGSGKSIIAASTIINALKNNKVDIVYYIDSEGGMPIEFFKKKKCNLDKIEHIPVASIEQCSVKILSLYDELVKAKKEYLKDPNGNDDIRALVVIDSFGALAADKLISDAVKKDQMVQDMGLCAKLKNNMMRGLMMRVVQSGATLLIINHEYADPSNIFSSKIHPMGGGKGLEFSSHVIVQCSTSLIKANSEDYFSGIEGEDTLDHGFYKGNKMQFFVVKSRLVKPGYTASIYIDFNCGLQKYDGLIDDSIKFGFIEKVRGGFIVPSYSKEEKIPYRKLISSDEIWNTFLDKFDSKSMESMAYSNYVSKILDQMDEKQEIK